MYETLASEYNICLTEIFTHLLMILYFIRMYLKRGSVAFARIRPMP